MKQKFINIRNDILDISYITKNGRLGTDFSVVEILNSIYDIKGTDLFVLSKGHAALSYYVVLSHHGYFKKEELFSYKKYKSKFGGHPDRLKVPGIEVSTGSLGHGIGVAVGMALGLKIQKSDRKVYVLVGDGESNEGTVWEAIMIAVNEKLDNLVIIFDVNQSQTRCLQLNNISGICREFGCRVEEINGHDESEILDSFNCYTKDKPLVVVANTIKGYPCKTLIDNKFEWHSKTPDEKYYELFKDELYDNSVYIETDLDDYINHRDPNQFHPQNISMKKLLPSNGWYRRYWSNGSLRYEWKYKDGKKADGISRGWYEDGQLKQMINWKNGKMHGLNVEYTPTGIRKMEGHWDRGAQIGEWKWWNPEKIEINGVLYKPGEKLQRIEVYGNDGEMISELIHYDPNHGGSI